MDCESLFTLIFIISFFFGIVAVSIIYSNAVFFSRLTTGVGAIQSQVALLCEHSVNITEKLSNLNGMFAEHAVLTHTENAAIQTSLQEFRQQFLESTKYITGRLDSVDQVDEQVRGLVSIVDLLKDNLAVLRNCKLDTLNEFHKELQQFIHAQYETNRDIINTVRSVDTRVEHHVALLQGCPPDEDELPLVEKPDLTDLVTSLYQIRDIVEAFKNDLITQVRLSREDYEELMATAESKDGRLIEQLSSLQTQLTDFRNAFDVFTR